MADALFQFHLVELILNCPSVHNNFDIFLEMFDISVLSLGLLLEHKPPYIYDLKRINEEVFFPISSPISARHIFKILSYSFDVIFCLVLGAQSLPPKKV